LLRKKINNASKLLAKMVGLICMSNLKTQKTKQFGLLN